MIILADIEKAFGKIQHPFLILKRNILRKLDIKSKLPLPAKGHYEKPTANITLNSEILNDFPKDQGRDQVCTVSTFVQP